MNVLPNLRKHLLVANLIVFGSAICNFVASGIVIADDFPELYNNDADPNVMPMPANEAAQKFVMPAGFEVSVFSSEPDVQNPIDMSWDSRGRIWIAENYTYADQSQRFDLSLRDRVTILEDTDRDGVADKRTVFSDQLQMLTSVEVGHGGVWVMCPPALLFIPDRDRNDMPDGAPEVVLDGFDIASENYHNFANGLRWGPDGWLYGRCGGSCPGRIGLPGTPDAQRVAVEGGIWRYHPVTKQIDVLAHGTTNPWGHDWNSVGECFFVNTVNGHLWHLIPGAHFVRPFTLDPNTKTYELIDMHADHWHFDTGKSWNQSRDGAANDYGGGHAHIGTNIYLGDNWPDQYRDKLFTFNFHGRRANQEILERHGSGYVGKHGEDILFSKDPFFRGMELSYGPDGAVYVFDWSDTGECHEHDGVHRTSGRVYRVSYGEAVSGLAAGEDLRAKSDIELAKLHTHKNEWYVRQSRLILDERSESGTVSDDCRSEFEKLLNSGDEAHEYRALMTLHVADLIEHDDLKGLMHHKSEYVRCNAIRILTETWPIDDCYGPRSIDKSTRERILSESKDLLPLFETLADKDQSGLVRLTLASTLQRLPLEQRTQLALRLVQRAEDADDHNLPLLVWYGLIPVAADQALAPTLAELATQCKWSKTQQFIVRRLTEDVEERPASVDTVLNAVMSRDNVEVASNVLAGMEDGLRGRRKVAPPPSWSKFSEWCAGKSDTKLPQSARQISVVFGDGRAMEDVRAIVLDPKAELNLRRSALESMVSSRAEDLHDVCIGVLGDARLNLVAAKGLSTFNSDEVGKMLVKYYYHFRAPDRPQIISLLSSRASFASALIAALEEGHISPADVSAFDVRQIKSLENPAVFERLTKVWGDLRDTPGDKAARISQLKETLTSESIVSADKARGRLLFSKSCAKCHRLYGQGEMIGPDLTGSNRNNLDYLLENIVDPSAVVSKDYRMSILLTTEENILNGLIVSKDDKTLRLQTQTELLTLPTEDIAEIKTTSLSPMPDGLLDNLTDDQVRDLMAYLMHPSQVEMAKE